MLKTKCFRDAMASMNPRDVDAIEQGVQARVQAGAATVATVRAAEIGAVNDVLAEIKRERAEILRMVGEQYPGATADNQPDQSQSPPQTAQATHADPGKAPETATKAVVTEAVQKAAQNRGRKPSEMRAELLAMVDEAIKEAPDYADFQEAAKTLGEQEAAAVFSKSSGRGAMGEKFAPSGYSRPTRTFKIKGDGTFTVNNTVRQLLKFRKLASGAFAVKGVPAPERATDALDRRSPGAAIVNMIDEGDPQAAVDYAAARGLDIAEVLKGDKVRLPKVAGLTPTDAEAVGEFEPEADAEPAAPAQPAAASAAPPAQQAEPAPVSSREGQMNLAYRGSRIAALKQMNDRLRRIAPSEAWADKNIENASNAELDRLQDQISAALLEAQRGPAPVNPLRAELEAMSGTELRDLMGRMGLAGKLMTAGERVDALLAEDPAEVRAAMQQAEPAGDMLGEFLASYDTPQEAGSARKALAATVTWKDGLKGPLSDHILGEYRKGARVTLTASAPAFVNSDMRGWSKRDIGEYGMQFANWLSSRDDAPAQQAAPSAPAAESIATQTFDQWARASYAANEYKASYLDAFKGNENRATLGSVVGTIDNDRTTAELLKAAKQKYISQLLNLPRETSISLEVYDSLTPEQQREAQRNFYDLDSRITRRTQDEIRARVKAEAEKKAPYEAALAEVNAEIKRLDADTGPETQKQRDLRARSERLREAIFQIGQGKEPDGRLLKTLKQGADSMRREPEEGEKAPAASPAAAPGVVENFGEALQPARRNMAAKLTEDLADDDIATRPLSTIWPLAENDAIEDVFAAAVAHAARAEIPAKPRVAYKLRTWVVKVKTLRGMAGKIVSGQWTKGRMAEKIANEFTSLRDWWSKVTLLEQIDREQWKRIGSVEERPQAHTYKGGKEVPAPMLRIEVDGKSKWLTGDAGVEGEARGTIAGNMAGVAALLETAKPEQRMAFEIRGSTTFKVNKKGDPEYRPLMTFATVAEARKAITEQYDSLVAAWEAVKARDNITERDLRSAENRPRVGKDYRKGRDITVDEFQSVFGFRGGEFGKWVQQGKGDKERQALLNNSYDALMDLADIIGVPPRALSLNGTLGIAFGSRGSGWASAHFEPSNLVINLTKTRGAGTLAHEWLHAADNYFARMRRGGQEAPFTGDQSTYRNENYITHRPEPLMVRKDRSRAYPAMTLGQLQARREYRKSKGPAGFPPPDAYDADKWERDPSTPEGVRPEVEARFADLVKALAESPMAKRAALLDKSNSGYWTRTLEMAARAFESYVIAKMHEHGYHNDFLVNVKKLDETGKSDARYPYLLAGEVKPIAEAFDALFGTIQTRADDAGNVAMFSRAPAPDTEAFRKWFGDSKVVDENGEPLVVYHGTRADFSVFKRSKEGKAGSGIYMTDDPSYTSVWSNGDGANVMPVYASIKNPIVVQQSDGLPLDAIADKYPKVFNGRDPFDMTGDEIAAAIRSAGFDGVVQQSRAGKFFEVMALDPEQIKSAIGNRGTFDPQNPDIRFSRAPAPDTETFRKWFAGSKVVDAEGKPLVVYHGTRADFSEFSRNFDGEGMSGEARNGFFFTSDPAEASDYAAGSAPGGRVMPVYVALKRPAVFEFADHGIGDIIDADGEVAAMLRKSQSMLARLKGTDGLMLKDIGGVKGKHLVVAFRPEQIKSATGNRGTFDPQNPDIRFSRASATATKLNDVQQTVDTITATWASPPEVRVVWDLQDPAVDEEVRAEDARQRRNGATGVPKAFYFRGKVYVVASAAGSEADVAKSLFHEALGHAGLRAAFGGQLKPILSLLAKTNRAAVEAKARAYGMDMNDEAQRLRAAEEVLAEIAETRPTSTWVQKAIAAIRTWLRDNLPEIFGSMKMSDAEIIRNFIVPARDAIVRGREAQGRDAVPRFMRGDEVGGDDPMFSRSAADAIREVMPQAVQDRLTDAFTSQRGFNRWWHRTVGTQLHKAKIDKEFGRVYYAVQDFMKDVSRIATRAADQAPDLLPQIETLKEIFKAPPKKADMQAASAALFDGTLRYKRNEEGEAVLAEADELGGLVWTDQELRSRGVSKAGVKLYRQARAAINASLDSMLAADIYRMVSASDQRALAGNDMEADALLARVRKAAASDDPRAAVRMVSAALQDRIDLFDVQLDANDIGEQAETVKKMREKVAEALQTISDKVDRINSLKEAGYAPLMRFGQYTVDVLNDKSERVFFGMYETQMAANEAARKFREQGLIVSQGVQSKREFELLKGLSPETAKLFAELLGVEQNEAMQEWLKNAVAEQSALKRHIRRKGIEGFDDDSSRVVAAFLTSNARAASRALHSQRVQDAVASVTKGDVKDEAIALAEYVNNPKEEAQAIRSLLFVQYIGGSVASAAVNLTQTFVQTFPFLAQYGGAGKAGKRIAAAMRAALGKIDDNELNNAIRQAEKDGVIKPQEVFQLQAEASRSLGSNIYVRKGLAAWGAMFQLAEQYNRRVAFIAAYQTAKEEGIADPFAFAENAVDETQSVFNKGNRPNWSRGAVGATLFTFKTFTIQYLEFLSRLPMEQRLLALAVLVLLSGAKGLPFGEDAEDLVDTIAQQMGYNWTTKDNLNRWLVSQLGQGWADFIQHGVSGISGVPLDVSQRLGMADLLPGTGVLKPSETRKENQVLEVFGVAGSAVRDVLQGEVRPLAIRNVAKALDMYDMGMYRDTRGRKITDTDAVDAALKGLGFQPSSVAREQRAVGREYEKAALYRKVKNDITERMALGRFENDPGKIAEAREARDRWNEQNPDAKITIDMPSVIRRVKEMRKSRTERFISSAPKDIRQQTAEALR